MNAQRHERFIAARRRRSSGISMIVVLVSLVALLMTSALAIDAGMVWSARTQLQNAADAAALAGADQLVDASGSSVTLGAAATVEPVSSSSSVMFVTTF